MRAPRFPKTRTRVVINALHAKSGGGVTYLRSILPHLARESDIEFHLILHEDQFALFDPVPENIRVHLFDFRSSFLGLLLWEQFALPCLARLMAADVTFSPANYGPLLTPRPVILLRNALSVVGGEKRVRKRFYWAGLAFMTLLSLATSRKAIAVSEYARRQLTFGTDRVFGKRTEIVHHGVDSAFRVQRRRDTDEPFLLAVSDIYVQKNLDTLIVALPDVFQRFPALRLKVAGRPNDTEYFATIQEHALALGIRDRIDFLGHRSTEELIDLYARCSVFVFPSTVETFGNPLVEAMACGAPIACSDSAAMPEIVGDAALYFDPGDPAGMARRLIQLLEDPEAAESLSRLGAERALRFSWERTARETCAVLRDAARNGNAS